MTLSIPISLYDNFSLSSNFIGSNLKHEIKLSDRKGKMPFSNIANNRDLIKY